MGVNVGEVPHKNRNHWNPPELRKPDDSDRLTDGERDDLYRLRAHMLGAVQIIEKLLDLK